MSDKIDDIIERVHNVNPSNTNTMDIQQQLDNLVKLEVPKIIIEKTLDDVNLSSLTFLDREHIDDILNAQMLNQYFQLPEIDNFIIEFMKLQRSNDGRLLKLFTQMGVFNRNDMDNDIFKKKGFFERILKR